MTKCHLRSLDPSLIPAHDKVVIAHTLFLKRVCTKMSSIDCDGCVRGGLLETDHLQRRKCVLGCCHSSSSCHRHTRPSTCVVCGGKMPLIDSIRSVLASAQHDSQSSSSLGLDSSCTGYLVRQSLLMQAACCKIFERYEQLFYFIFEITHTRRRNCRQSH